MVQSDVPFTAPLSESMAVALTEPLGQDGVGLVGDSSPSTSQSVKIMIVDDEPTNIMVVQSYLEDAGYDKFVSCEDATLAFGLIQQELPDLVLLDVMMPGVNGLEILELIRADRGTRSIPVLILTALQESEVEKQALDLGATDFLGKPIRPHQLTPRVRNALTVKAYQQHLENQADQLEHQVQLRTAELAESRQDVIRCLARAAEFRDDDTGRHVVRVGRYAGIIAHQLGFSQQRVELIEQAAQLHDVGKIGIPDAVLLKPGKLDPNEYALMKQHCEFGDTIIQPQDDDCTQMQRHAELGAKIMKVSRSPIITVAAIIAQTHHEKWDGSGYPKGLAGEEIPIEGRITAVADVFDALSTKRPYKPAFPWDKCLRILEESRGSHFDPCVLDAFLARQEEIKNAQARCADEE